MPDRSEEPSIEELEAELGVDDAGATSSTDADDGDLGLDEDASAQYGDLLDDGPTNAGGGDAADASAGAADAPSTAGGSDADGGGLLSRLFGSGDESAADAGTDATVEPAAGSDALEGIDGIGGVDGVEGLDDGSPAAGGTASDAAATAANSGSRFAWLGSYFSLRVFLAALVATTFLGGVGRFFVPLIGGVAGLAAGAFLVALASGDGRYLEAGLAGALVGAIGTLAGGLSVAFATGAATRLLAVGGVGGLVLALLGAYFGNDLRAGLVGGSEDWSEEEEL